MIDVATYVMDGDDLLHELTTQWGEQYDVPDNRERAMVSTLRFYLDAPMADRIVFKLPEGCREIQPLLYQGWVVLEPWEKGWGGYKTYLCSGRVPE